MQTEIGDGKRKKKKGRSPPPDSNSPSPLQYVICEQERLVLIVHGPQQLAPYIATADLLAQLVRSVDTADCKRAN